MCYALLLFAYSLYWKRGKLLGMLCDMGGWRKYIYFHFYSVQCMYVFDDMVAIDTVDPINIKASIFQVKTV